MWEQIRTYITVYVRGQTTLGDPKTIPNPLAKAEAFVPVPFVAMSEDRSKGLQFPDIGSSCIMISRATCPLHLCTSACAHI